MRRIFSQDACREKLRNLHVLDAHALCVLRSCATFEISSAARVCVCVRETQKPGMSVHVRRPNTRFMAQVHGRSALRIVTIQCVAVKSMCCRGFH